MSASTTLLRRPGTTGRAATAATAAIVAAALALSACDGSAGEPQAFAETATSIAVSTTSLAPTTTAAPTTLAPTSTAATTTTTTTTVPATTTSTLPRQTTTPIAPPTDTRAAEPVIEMGRIAIPKIGVDSTMYEGIRLSTLDYGPGHWPGSALPGQIGNLVVAGHRTSKHQIFRKLDQLVAGDEIVFSDGTGEHVYRVTGVEIVGPDALWIVDPTDTPKVTLFACHPPGSTAQRIVVHADLVI